MSDAVRILVTGSRTWDDRLAVREALEQVVPDVDLQSLIVVHGACPEGADLWANEWAIDYHVQCERHPANWDLGKAAGFIRNGEMVDLGADLVLGFVRPCVKPGCKRKEIHGSHGAVDCLHRAVKAGLRIQQWFDPAVTAVVLS